MDTVLLVKKAKRGDKDALVQLIMAQKQDFYKLAYIYMKNEQDTLDVMQNMIVVLYESIRKLRKESSFYSWSRTILVNCCKSQLQKNKKIVSLDNVREEAYDGKFSQRDTKLMLKKYLSLLNPEHQEVIKLRYFLDLDYKTIAETLDIPLGTVKSRIHMGLKNLRQRMEVEGYERA